MRTFQFKPKLCTWTLAPNLEEKSKLPDPLVHLKSTVRLLVDMNRFLTFVNMEGGQAHAYAQMTFDLSVWRMVLALYSLS